MSWVIARGKSVAARSWSCSKPSHTGLTTRLRPTCDRKMLQSWAYRRKNVRVAAEVVRLVAEVVGDRKGQISRNKVDGHVQNLKPAIPNRKRSHDLVVQLVVTPYDRWHHQSIAHAEFHDWSYGRSPGATIDRTIEHLWLPLTGLTISYDMVDLVIDLLHSVLIARPRVRPIVRWPITSKKTDRSTRPLLEIVANIADRSHVRQITTNRTIKQSYDPVWMWL